LWGDGIILSQSGIDFTAPYLLQAENDSVYLIWHKETGPYYAPNRGLYEQKLDVNGNFLWTSDVEVYAPVPSGPVVNLQMCRDDSGGIVFSWYRAIDATHFHCYVQRMDADGTISMPANGVLASTTTARLHMYPAPAFLSQTQEIVLFFSEQDLNQNMRGMYAQKFDLQGNRLWGDEGIALIGLSNNDYGLFTAGGKDNQAICIYQAAEFGNADSKIQAVMLDDQGNFVWPEQFIDLSTYQSEKLHNVMTDYYMGQWVAVWQDRRNDDGDIYAQNIQPDGTLGVVINQPPVADFTWAPSNPTSQSIVQFTDLSYDPVGDIVNWTWDFGDGNSSFDQHPTHQYNNPGTYTVCLTVIDNDGANDSVSKDVEVNNPATFLDLNITGGIGISITTKNVGDYNATNVTTHIRITGGILNHINITRDGPFVSPLPPGDTLKGKVYPIGLGPITIDVTISADNAALVTKTAEGIIVLFFVILK
jgi:PKD repeat protein